MSEYHMNEMWFYHHTVIEIVNSYKYLGYTLTTKLSSHVACREYSNKVKGKILDLMKTMWSLGSFDSSLFFKLFDCQVKPMLLYVLEIWGTTNIHVIETAHLFACKMLLNVSDKTPNNKIYGETGRNPTSYRQHHQDPKMLVEDYKYAIKSISKASIHYVKKRLRNNYPKYSIYWASYMGKRY